MPEGAEEMCRLGDTAAIYNWGASLIIVGEKAIMPENHDISLTDGQSAVQVDWGILGISWKQFRSNFSQSLLGEGNAILARSDNNGNSVYVYNRNNQTLLIIVGRTVPEPRILNIVISVLDVAVIIPAGLLKEVMSDDFI